MSVSRTFGPVQRPGLERDLTELFQRVEVLERIKQAATTGAAMVWGAVLNDAGIIAGTGFTVSWDNNGGAPFGANFYTITFSTPFINPPVVDLTPNNDSPATLEGRYQVSLVTRNTDYIVVRTDDIDDADDPTQDGGFDFIAMEPAV